MSRAVGLSIHRYIAHLLYKMATTAKYRRSNDVVVTKEYCFCFYGLVGSLNPHSPAAQGSNLLIV